MRKLGILFLLLSGVSVMQAVPVTWYINSLTFSDGGTGSGSFVYDAATNTYSAINLFTTPGTSVTTSTAAGAGANYTQQSAGFATASQNVLVTDANIVIGVTRGITFIFAAPLTDAGGTITLQTAQPEGFCNVAACNFVNAGFRIITGGSVTAAPVNGPQTWYLRNIRFDDGGLAIGSFTYNATTNAYSNIDVWVTPGTTFAASRHYVTASPTAGAGLIALVVSNPAQAGDRLLAIGTAGAKANAPGTLNIGGGGTTAEVTCASVNCTALAGSLRQITSGSVTTIRPAGYAAILSDIVDGSFSGSQFQTTVIATNLSDQPVAFDLTFFQDNGTLFNVPGIGNTTVQTVPAHGTAFFTSTGGTGTGVQGWARVRGAENLSVSAVFTQKNANAGGDVQNVVNSEPVNTATFSVPFDNTNGAVGGFALTNPDSTAVKVLAVAYDNAGNIILNDSSITLNPLSHTAFNFQNQAGYNVLVNKKGVLRIFAIPTTASVTPPLLGLDGLLIKFLPNNSTATVTALHQ